MIEFIIDLKKDYDLNQNEISPFIKEFINVNDIEKSSIIFVLYFIRTYKKLLYEKLNELNDLLDKLKIKKDDIIKGINIRLLDNKLIIKYDNEIYPIVKNIEYGMPGINGIPTTKFFSKFNKYMEDQYKLLLISYNNYK